MGIQLRNNAVGFLTAPIGSSDTSITLQTGNGAKFPALGGSDYFYATLSGTDGSSEIVKATARTGDTLTVVRAQEGTTVASFSIGSRIEMRVTAASVRDLVEEHDEAVEISVADAGGYFAANNVEGVLQEIGAGGGSFGAFTFVDNFTGNGTTTVFTLGRAPIAQNLIDVYINGVYQEKTSFSFLGTALTFLVAPPLGAGVEVVTNANITSGAISSLNVLYDPAGLGAVPTTVQTKLRENVSVKDFGAVGDGVTDDTAAIVFGMNACIAAGKALFFPAGTYLITSTINLDTLSTAGQMVTLIGEEGAYYRTDTSGVKPTVLLGGAGLTQLFSQPFAGVLQRRLTVKNFSIRSQDPFTDTVRAPLRAFDIYNSPYSIYENIDTIGITSLLHLRTAYFCKLSKIQTGRTTEGIFIDGDDGAGGYGFADHVSLTNIVTGGLAGSWGTRLRGSKSSNITMFDCETGTSGPGLIIEGCKEINVTNVYAEGFINANPIAVRSIVGSSLDNLEDFCFNITIDGVHGQSNTSNTIVLQNGVFNVTIRNVREYRVDAAGRESATGDWLQVSVGALSQNSLIRFHDINLEGFFASDKTLPAIVSAAGFNQCFRINGNIIQSETNRAFYGLSLQRGTNYNNTGLSTKELVLTNGTLSSSTLTMTATTTNGSRKITVTNTTDLFPGTFITVGAQTGLFVTSIDRATNTVWLGTQITATASGVAVSYTTPTYL